MRLTGIASTDEWWFVADNCAYATLFHTPSWASIIEATYQGTIRCPMRFELDDGRIAILPTVKMYSRLRGKLSLLESMPPFVRGGPICTRTITRPESMGILALAAENGVLELRDHGNPFLEQHWQSTPETSNFSHLLRLDGLTHDDVWRKYSKGNKSSTRKGQREGVVVRKETSPDAYAAYYDIYQDSLRRWGDKATSRHPKELFSAICNNAGENAILWMAHLNDRPVAGALLLYWGGIATYWHGAALEEAMSASPTNVIIDLAIADAISRNLTGFDFGESGGHEGVQRFKESFGAEKVFFSKHHLERKWLRSCLRAVDRVFSKA